MTSKALADRRTVTDLLSRYFGAVDDKRLDAAIVAATFADDARLVRPNGSALVGPQEILTEQRENFARFRATHHVTTDHVIEVDADVAQVRANLTAMHLWAYGHSDPRSLESSFLAGGVLRAVAVRTPAGWRLSELELRNVWRTGGGFGAMAQTGADDQ